MSNKILSQQDLKEIGLNRYQRRFLCGVNKRRSKLLIAASHHPIPSWRKVAVDIVNAGRYV